MRRQGFRGDRVVVVVPEDKLVTGMLELPPRTSGAPLDEIARAELARMHSYNPQEAEAIYWDLPVQTRRAGAQAMAVACRHADAETVLAAFEDSGLEPVALEGRLHALLRGCRPVLSGAGTTAILDLEWGWSMLILTHQGTVVYRRIMPEAAVEHLFQTLRERLAMDEALVQHLIREVGLEPRAAEGNSCAEALAPAILAYLDTVAASVRSPFAYVAQQYQGSSVERLLVTGGGAGIPGLAANLSSRLGIEVRTVSPADVVTCPAQIAAKGRDPSYTLAVGSAQFTE
jgi:type IV pilus assembly protein PilM